MKYIKTYNEKLGGKLSAPTEDEIYKKLDLEDTYDILDNLLYNNFKIGYKYVLDNRKKDLNKNTIYIIEKYVFGLHQNDEKEYEKYFYELIKSIKNSSSEFSNRIVYKKDNDIIFIYDKEENNCYLNIEIIEYIYKQYKIPYFVINLMIKFILCKYLNNEKINIIINIM